MTGIISNHRLRWLSGFFAAVSICENKPSWLMKKPQHPQQCCTIRKGASPLPFGNISNIDFFNIISIILINTQHQIYFCNLITKYIIYSQYLEGTSMQTLSGGFTSGIKKARMRRVSCTASMLRHRNKYFLKFLLSYLW